MGGKESKVPSVGIRPSRRVDDVVPGFSGHLIDSVMMYNFIQYVELWGGWMIIYDLRQRHQYEKDHIANAVWGWDGSDSPGDFKTRLFDETSYVVVVIYDEFGGISSNIQNFITTLHLAGTTPTATYFLEDSIDTFRKSFPCMMASNKDKSVSLPGPYLPIRNEKGSPYPSVFVLDEKQLPNAQKWIFRVLKITKVLNMGSAAIIAKKADRIVQNFVTFQAEDLPKIYTALLQLYLNTKKKGNVLIIDREGFDYGTQLCGCLLVRRSEKLEVNDVVDYLGRIRPDMEEKYLDSIAK